MSGGDGDTADHIPIIDVAGLYGTSADLSDVAAAVGAACRGIGFFYVVGHRVPAALVDAVFRNAAALFGAPPAVKDAVAYARSAHNRGYIGMGVEALDPGKPSDLKQAFNVGLDLAADDPDVVAGRPFRGVNLWPDLPGFRDTTLAYFDACAALGGDLHRAFAADLGIDADFFADKFRRPMATLRLLYYPPRPATVAEGQLGAGEHTDYGNVTLLSTDAVGGLEVRTRDGRWLAAPAVPGAFVCNIGDCLMRWTNDVYVSTPHRVVNPSGRERYSVAFFFDPDPDAVVECLPSCIDAAQPPRYRPVTAADFLRSRLEATYAHARKSP